MDSTVATALAGGFVLGLQHALDPDYLVAVSTIVSDHKSLRRSSLIGTFWGLGHSLSLLGVGLVIILLSVDPRSYRSLDGSPCCNNADCPWNRCYAPCTKRTRVQIHTHVHEHGQQPHEHVHVHIGKEHNHMHQMFKFGRRPFAIGLVHGFAGSAA